MCSTFNVIQDSFSEQELLDKKVFQLSAELFPVIQGKFM